MPSGKMVQVAIWMTFACICFSAMNGIVRHLGGSIEPIIVVFFRCLFGLVGMAPFLLRSGLTSLHTQNPLLHGIRGLIAVVGMCCWFYGINHMPLAEAVALGFTTPLFSSIAAVILLGEVMRRRRWTATIVGFVGTLIVLRPGFEEFGTGSLLILIAALLMAVKQVMVKYLTGKDHPNAIVFWLVFLVLPLSFMPAVAFWESPSGHEWFWLVGLGLIATLAHQSVARSFALADATAVVPFEFMRLPFVAFIGFMAFDETPDIWTWIGAGVIVSSSVYITHREARLGQNIASEKSGHLNS